MDPRLRKATEALNETIGIRLVQKKMSRWKECRESWVGGGCHQEDEQRYISDAPRLQRAAEALNEFIRIHLVYKKMGRRKQR